MDGPDLIWTALLHGFNESMEISPWIHRIHGASMPELRRFSRRWGKAWRRSKIVGEQIEEPHRRSIEEQRNWFIDR
ncbi:hypothetical protein ACOSQ2_012773 [Xanthoceras sorbifolium]